jgi:hypothetical protein
MAPCKSRHEVALYSSGESGQRISHPSDDHIISMRFRMETTTSRDTLRPSLLLTPEERLKLWQRFKGMWKNRTPDPLEELEKIRKEWDRTDR